MYNHAEIDNRFLNKIRYESGYNPFSYKFNVAKNNSLYEDAKKEGASEAALSIIQSGKFFHEEFWKPLSKEIKVIYEAGSLSKIDTAECFIALINNQFVLLQEKFGEYLEDKEGFSAFDVTNATFTLSESPTNPQGFTSNAEGFADHINTLLSYLFSSYCAEQPTVNKLSDGKLNLILRALHGNVNQYHGIKSHYETCLFYGGRIEIGVGEILFDSTITKLNEYQTAAIVAIQNQRMKKSFILHRYFHENPHAQKYLTKANFKRVLDKVNARSGLLTYTLRQRKEGDFSSLIDSIVAAEDYYSFYVDEPIGKLANLNISEILRLHAELCHFVTTHTLQLRFDKEEKSKREFLDLFVPKVKKSVLKSYLASVSSYSNQKIEAFIDLLTVEQGKPVEVFATPLIQKDDYYFFPFLPLSRPNYYFLIDFWLEKAGVSLTSRGPAFEKYCKQKLARIKQGPFNIFKVIDQTEFSAAGGNEEIDLIIETKSSLIVAELKCVKYPMTERDLYLTLSETIVGTAVEQINRKANFLLDHAHLLPEIDAVGKKLIKVIVTNFPVFSGIRVNGIPVVDVVTFLAYFQTNSMRAISDNLQEPIQSSDVATYYNSKEEFCVNLEKYITDNPLNNVIFDSLESSECAYQLGDSWKIRYKTIIANQEKFNLYIEQRLNSQGRD